MKGKRVLLLIGLLILVALGTMAIAQPSASSAQSGQVRLQFLIELPPTPKCEPDTDPSRCPTPVGDLVRKISNLGSSGEDGFVVDSFFDISYVRNIGSSGLDGNTTTFQVDSFFDVFYEIKFDNPKGGGDRTIQTEMLSMDLSATPNDPTNPAGAIDAVTRAVRDEVGGHVHKGHVTILK